MSKKRNTRVRYDKLVPPDSFLGHYLEYMDANETPYAYDFWTGLWLLSCAVGRNVVVNRPRAPVYLNLFLILVAESGVTRKSTSVRSATDFARPLCSDNPLLIEGRTTPESLIDVLHRQTVESGAAGACISVSELATFLGRERYMSAMPTLLTDLYDCPTVRTLGGTLSSGRQELRNVFVSFLSASTPSWLLRSVNPDVIEGGFTSRVCFVVSEEPKRREAWPSDRSETQQSTCRELLEKIRLLSEDRPNIEISEGGRKTFDRWYRSRTLHRDVFRASFQSREDAHILRIAALLSINDGTWTIQHAHVLSAIRIVTQVREDGASIFEGTGSNGKFISGIDKIRDKLLAAGQSGLPQRDLTKATAPYMNAEHLNAVLDIMHELQMVHKFTFNPSVGRPTTVWRGTSVLVQPKALDTIIDNFAPTRT